MATERRACETCGKQCLTRAEAHRAARNLNGHQQNDGWPVHAFQCGSWWHTGHVPARDRTRNKRKPSRRTRTGVRPRPVTPPEQLPPELR